MLTCLCTGRALAILHDQVVDLGDDYEGENSGEVWDSMTKKGLFKVPPKFDVPKLEV